MTMEPGRNDSPEVVVTRMRKCLAGWTPADGAPTYQAVADYLNERGCYTARGKAWGCNTLYNSLARYRVPLRELMEPVEVASPRPPSAFKKEDVLVELARDALTRWAERWSLIYVPHWGQVARDLNEYKIPAPVADGWSASSVKSWLKKAGFDGDVETLLRATGWVGGRGRTRDELEAFATARRKEALRPTYERIRDRGIDIGDPRSSVEQQVGFLVAFEKVDFETALLRHYRVPAETMGLVELYSLDVSEVASAV